MVKIGPLKFLFLLAIGGVNMLAAQAPQKMNYQAVVRDATGNPLPANTQVSILFRIHDGTPLGPVVFTEETGAITNQFGLVNMQIGNNGNLNSVNWSTGDKYLQVLADATGGTNYVDMGTTQMLSVPYALFAANSLNGPAGATGPTGPPGGPAGPVGPTGAAGSSGALVHAVRGTFDVTLPQSFDTAVVYYDAPEMKVSFTPVDSNALVTFSASGDYAALIPTNAQWLSARILVNGIFKPGQGASWIVGVNDQGQSYNTAWGASMTIPIKLTVGLSTIIKIQWSYTTGLTGQFNLLQNRVLTDPSQTSHRSLSVIEYGN